MEDPPRQAGTRLPSRTSGLTLSCGVPGGQFQKPPDHGPASASPQANTDRFVDNWLQEMDGAGLLVEVNFNADLAGLELTPQELASALTREACPFP